VPRATGRSAEVLRARGGVGVEVGAAGHVWQSHISKNVGPVKSFFRLFFFLSTAFFFFYAHFTIHSCEWSCWFSLTLCIDDHGSLVI
jgi:hypothetical protein